MVGQTRAHKNVGRSFLRWSRNQVDRIIRYLLCVFLCEKISSEPVRQGDELLSALISSQLDCHISQGKNAGQSEPRRMPAERIVRSDPPEIRRENCVAFSSAFSRQRDTRCSAEDDPARFVRVFPSRAWHYCRNFRGCMREFTLDDIFFLVKKFGITVRDKRVATWKALIICPCFAYLRDVAKARRFSSRRPESRNFFRELYSRHKLSLSPAWNNASSMNIIRGKNALSSSLHLADF